MRAGADWINDVWALRGDPEMAHVVSHHGVPVILMHNRSKPNSVELDTVLGGQYVGATYQDLLEDVKAELLNSVKIARKAHIEKDRIILDPGLGFGKSVRSKPWGSLSWWDLPANHSSVTPWTSPPTNGWKVPAQR